MIATMYQPLSRFGQMYSGRLQDWADNLKAHPGTIVVATARKGPRLLELLVLDGFLPRDFMKRVTSHRALPFISDSPGGIIVTDDSIVNGITFLSVLSLAEDALRRSKSAFQVIGIPFALGPNASREVRTRIDKYFLQLNQGEFTSFINNEVSSFRLLGKPLDIEHPILSVFGQFDNPTQLEKLLSQVATRLQGHLIPLHSEMLVGKNIVRNYAWSIVFETSKIYSAGLTPEFRKLRIFLDHRHSRLCIAAMAPHALNSTSVNYLAAHLTPLLGELWLDVYQMAHLDEVQNLRNTTWHSLAMWANFLNSMYLLSEAKNILLDELDNQRLRITWNGPQEDDLQLLVGPALAKRAEAHLNAFLRSKEMVQTDFQVVAEQIPSRFPDQKIPPEFSAKYQQELQSLLRQAVDVGEVIQAVFYAQHRTILRPTLKKDILEPEYGITFQGLCRTVHETLGRVDEKLVHRFLDRLIDDGAVVPRYINMSDRENAPIWVRAFRAGEGMNPDVVHLIRLLHSNLATAIRGRGTPFEAFEKFAVLAVKVARDNSNLIYLGNRIPAVSKDFHLYGARLRLDTGWRNDFLTDWAVSHKILNRDERSERYHFNSNMDYIYPPESCPWDKEVIWAIEDLAQLVSKIHRTDGLGIDALVALTSVLTNKELHRAVEVELHLWLHDEQYSVYDSLRILGYLAIQARKRSLSQHDLHIANAVLSKTANFTAQVNYKKQVSSKRDAYIAKIDDLMQRNHSRSDSDKLARRAWESLRPTLVSRVQPEQEAPGLEQILATLELVYRTNGTLRDLLTAAGYVDPKGRGRPIDESISMLRDKLSELDPITRAMFALRDHRMDLDDMLQEALEQLPPRQPSAGFPEMFDVLRPVILEISSRCEAVLRHHGSVRFKESPVVLDPPRYIVMWDIRKSSEYESRDELDQIIAGVNQRIAGTLTDQIFDFRAESKDDGNGLICTSFHQVLAVLGVLLDEYAHKVDFRVGCQVNLEGRLNYYPQSKSLGGRAFEYAARIRDVFKELELAPQRWLDADCPQPITGSYIVVGEFAYRFAEDQQEWSPQDLGLRVWNPPGRYRPRVQRAFPSSVYILVPEDR